VEVKESVKVVTREFWRSGEVCFAVWCQEAYQTSTWNS
jgi:hypothetical protein